MDRKRLALTILCVICTKVSFAGVGINVTPNTWNVGTGGAGEWTSNDFTATNIGDSTAKVNIRATDTQNWTLAAVPALNQFSVLFSNNGTSWTSVTPDNTVLTPSLNGNSALNFKLRFQSPTDISDKTLNTPQVSTVTVSVASLQIGAWNIVNTNLQGMQPSAVSWLAVDTGGMARMCYVSNGLAYAERTVNGWEAVIVPQTESAQKAILKLDNNNNPIMIFDNASGGISLAQRSQALDWTVETLAYSGFNSSLALDSQGNPHVLYFGSDDNGAFVLKYAKRTAGQWSTEVVEGVSVGQPPILAIGPDNNPSFCIWNDGQIRYFRWENGWQSEIIPCNPAMLTGFVIDKLGHPHMIAYENSGTYNLFHAKRNETGWTFDTIDAMPQGGDPASLAIGSDNSLHVAYYTNPQESGLVVMYAWYSGSAWEKTLVESTDNNNGLSIALDPSNRPFICHILSEGYIRCANWQ